MRVTREDAKRMDIVLNYLLNNKTARLKYKQIMDLLNIDLDEAKFLHQSILKYHHETKPIISIHNALNIGEKPIDTEEFLRNGGFEAICNQQHEIEHFNKIKKSKFLTKSNFKTWISKNSWFTFIIAALGFIFGLVSLLISFKIIKLE